MALVANIHYGLAAYAAGAFTVGQRCSNAGNAYQCTAPGNSTTAPTGTGSSISGGGGTTFKWLSAIDYTTLQAWADALPATLTQAAVGLLWNDAPYTTTVGAYFLVLTGHVTTPTNNITIRPAPGESFIDTLTANPNLPLAFNAANGVSFIQPSSGAGGINYILFQDDNVVVYGIQFQDPNSTSNSTIIQPTQNCAIQSCIFDGYSQAGGAYMLNPTLGGAATSRVTMTNCLVIDRADPSSSTSTFVSDYNTTLANNTFVAINSPAGLGCYTDVSTAAGVVVNQTNNIMLGYTSPSGIIGSQNGSTVINVRNVLTSASSFTNPSVVAGAGDIYSAPTIGQFVNQATNFRLIGSSQAVAAGFTDTTDVPSATDIIGTARVAPWSIGSYQFVSPKSAGTANGVGSAMGTSGGPRSVGVAAGQGSASGVSFLGATGTAAGHASAAGVSKTAGSVGVAAGIANVAGYSSLGSIGATITVANPGAQVVNTAFPVVGTFTLVPQLQVSDDTTVNFTPIPASGISPLGTSTFEFVHPGLSTSGLYNLLVEDLSTTAAAAVSYPVTSTPQIRASVAASGAIGASLTGLPSIIPAYVYQEYSDDANIQAFFQAYNILAQGYLDYMNSLNLPIYMGLSGALLDWVALGLYGMPRPVLAAVQYGNLIGPFNTYQLDEIPINANIGTSTSTVFPVTDDIFKRIITWSFYKGDGTTFSVTWLKRRVMRFLAGANGIDYTGPTAQVSVSFTGASNINIKLSAGTVPLTIAPVLQAAVLSGVVPLPFQYKFSVLV